MGLLENAEKLIPDLLEDNRSQISSGANIEVFKCSADTRIYIDTLFLREALGIGYRESVSRVPIYGYDSIYFDFVLEGRSMVSGVLLMNLIKPGQLFDALRSIGYAPNPLSAGLKKAKTERETYDNVNKYYAAIKDFYFGEKKAESEETRTAPATFNIQIVNGNLNDKETFPSTITLKNVWIIENSVMPSSPDSPLVEKYQFIAQKITHEE